MKIGCDYETRCVYDIVKGTIIPVICLIMIDVSVVVNVGVHYYFVKVSTVAHLCVCKSLLLHIGLSTQLE